MKRTLLRLPLSVLLLIVLSFTQFAVLGCREEKNAQPTSTPIPTAVATTSAALQHRVSLRPEVSASPCVSEEGLASAPVPVKVTFIGLPILRNGVPVPPGTVVEGVALEPDLGGRWEWASAGEMVYFPRQQWATDITYSINFTGSFLSKDYSLTLNRIQLKSEGRCYREPPYKITGTGVTSEGKPRDLSITFSDELGPISYGSVSQGITIEPSLEGEWTWSSRRELRFSPKKDWKPGQPYTVTTDRSLFAAGTVVPTLTYSFRAEPFSAAFQQGRFAVNPTPPAYEKQAVCTFSFQRPVDRSHFEKAVSVTRAPRHEPHTTTPLQFSVSYNQESTQAQIVAPVTLEQDEGLVVCQVRDGYSSAANPEVVGQGGNGHVLIPDRRSYFNIVSASFTNVPNERTSGTDQVLILETSTGVAEEELRARVEVYELPEFHPEGEAGEKKEPYEWSGADDPARFIAHSRRLSLEPLPSDALHRSHSFRFSAQPRRSLFLRILGELTSLDGYRLSDHYTLVSKLSELPKSIRIMAPGSLLGMTGEKKLSVMVRDVSEIEIEAYRILPNSVHHLISHIRKEDISVPSFKGYFKAQDIGERLVETRRFPTDLPGRVNYTSIDFASLLRQQATLPRGLFVLTVKEKKDEKGKTNCWGPEEWQCEGADDADDDAEQGHYYEETQKPSDSRLVLVTDLGLVAKKAVDDSLDLFVQSFSQRAAIAGVKIAILGRNGLPVAEGETDSQGHVRLPSVKSLTADRAPTIITASHADDFAYLPYNWDSRLLDVSRFDIGGSETTREGLDAYLFSDRGVYRPGEEARVGIAVKGGGWSQDVTGLPLELVVSDPRGMSVRTELIKVPEDGLLDFTHRFPEEAFLGKYEVGLYLKKDERERNLLGTTQVRVEEFLPDTMKIKAHFADRDDTLSWRSPSDDIPFVVDLTNLFGLPAQGRAVNVEYTITPTTLEFEKWKGFSFQDPFGTQTTISNELPAGTTDERGTAQFIIPSRSIPLGTYKLSAKVEGFEADGGRTVQTLLTSLISPRPYLVGFKPSRDLSFIKQNEPRAVRVVVIDPHQTARAADLRAELIELSWESVLTRNPQGDYAYRSEEREKSISTASLSVPDGGVEVPLDTGRAGRFALRLIDGDGTILNRIVYEVAGEGMRSVDLSRRAECDVTVERTVYQPGEKVIMNVTTPYVGTGLITLERERVYAHRWFTMNSSSATQEITIPADFEGTGYINVTFVRSLDAKEVYLSPLSYAVTPIEVRRDDRVTKLSLSAPEQVQPGGKVEVHYSSERPTRAILYAVDEGIWSVARYKVPDPYRYFFRKRELGVQTWQMLDLLLPEYSVLQALAAAGGDEDALARHLNPFKRRGKPPVAFWHGIVDVDSTDRVAHFDIPSSFNGTVRVAMVAISKESVGAASTSTFVRAPLVVTAHMPLAVVPGDIFEASVSVTNDVAGTGEAKVAVAIDPEQGLELVEPVDSALVVPERGEKTVRVKLRAGERLGEGRIRATAQLGDVQQFVEESISIRPPTTRVSRSVALKIEEGKEVPLTHEPLYEDLRELSLTLSQSPLGYGRSLMRFVSEYPYGCTEQVVSAAWPAVLAKHFPDIAPPDREKLDKSLKRAFSTLRSRQGSSGGVGLWYPSDWDIDDSLQPYIALFLTQAREVGILVPPELRQNLLKYLRAVAAREVGSISEARRKGFAIYVLTRSGVVTSSEVESLQQWYRNYLGVDPSEAAKRAQFEPLTLLLASSYKLLHADKAAADWVGRYTLRGLGGEERYSQCWDYYLCNARGNRFFEMSLLARHFGYRTPQLLPTLEAELTKMIAQTPTTIEASYLFELMASLTDRGHDESGAQITLVQRLIDGTKQEHVIPSGRLSELPLKQNVRALSVAGTQVLYGEHLQRGFYKRNAIAPFARGIEIFREIRNEEGEPVTKVSLQDKVNVVIRVKSKGERPLDDLVIVDLLSGALDVEMSPRRFDAADSSNPLARFGFGLTSSTLIPKHAEAREDRVLLFGGIGSNATAEFHYTARAVARGVFVIPPLYAEAMYEPSLSALTEEGKIEVE